MAAYFLFELHFLGLLGTYRTLFKKLALAAGLSFFVLALFRFFEMIVVKRTHVKSLKYNLVRLFRLITVLVILMICISFLFQNWYTAAVSLGLISLILGFALQTPISSFIGWLYIILRNPYHVGDRIQIDTFKGDVVEINYLDTTLWEFGGDYLTNDLPSGRLIRFPNSLVLQSAVFNYSWVKFPYIWNEIPFHIAYESDFEYVESTLKTITKNELGPEIENKIRDLKNLVQQTPVDELEIKEYPFVCFRINTNTWVEASVTYLVEPKQAASIRSRIIKNAVAALLKEPDKVMFPKSNNR
jgi:small-conductance mechanosensitive channel